MISYDKIGRSLTSRIMNILTYLLSCNQKGKGGLYHDNDKEDQGSEDHYQHK